MAQISIDIPEELKEELESNPEKFKQIQELVRDALQNKIFEDMEVKEEYEKVLKSKDATTFSSEEESERFYEEMKKKTGIF